MKSFQLLLITIISSLTFDVFSQEYITMKKEENGVYTIPCEVNGLRLRFILDTGASSVSISLTEASFMLKNGYLEETDIKGLTNTQTADGQIGENYLINLREVKIGTVVLNNVRAVVSKGLDAPLLLGQSVLDNIGNWSVRNGQLVLNDIEPKESVETIDDLISYCNILNNNGQREAIFPAILSYKDKDNIKAMALFLKFWNTGDEYQEYLTKCLDTIEHYNYSDINQKYEYLTNLAYFYIRILNNKKNGRVILERIARDENFPFNLRSDAYESLYIFYKDIPLMANSYAKEALGKGMFDMAMWYCDYYLLENGKYAEAFRLYKQGYMKGNIRCSFGLGRGYIQGIWPEKSVSKGLKILDNLAQTSAYPDAIFDLCDYYWERNDFKKMITYANMFEDNNEKGIYQAIAYYNLKDYSMAKNRLGTTNPIYLIRFDLKAQYYGLLGDIFERGLGCTPSFENAQDCYEKLIQFDAGWGYACLGDLFLNTMFEKKNYETALKYFTIGANNDNGYCYLKLAQLYKYGLGTYQSDALAESYKQEAAKRGVDVSILDD